MDIQLKNIIPHPIKDRDLGRSDIWNREFLFSPGIIHVAAPSGTGKTTLANIIYGLRHDFSGAVFYGDTEAADLTIEDWADLRQTQLAIEFQDLKLFGEYSGLENILVKARLTEFAEKKSLAMANHLNIGHLLEKPANRLSQGERQRVALVRTLSQPFKWLILDEPFSHLDEKNTTLAAEVIQQRLDEEKASLIVLQLGDDDHFAYTQKLNL